MEMLFHLQRCSFSLCFRKTATTNNSNALLLESGPHMKQLFSNVASDKNRSKYFYLKHNVLCVIHNGMHLCYCRLHTKPQLPDFWKNYRRKKKSCNAAVEQVIKTGIIKGAYSRVSLSFVWFFCFIFLVAITHSEFWWVSWKYLLQSSCSSRNSMGHVYEIMVIIKTLSILTSKGFNI